MFSGDGQVPAVTDEISRAIRLARDISMTYREMIHSRVARASVQFELIVLKWRCGERSPREGGMAIAARYTALHFRI